MTKINMKVTHLKCHSNLPGANMYLPAIHKQKTEFQPDTSLWPARDLAANPTQVSGLHATWLLTWYKSLACTWLGSQPDTSLWPARDLAPNLTQVSCLHPTWLPSWHKSPAWTRLGYNKFTTLPWCYLRDIWLQVSYLISRCPFYQHKLVDPNMDK